MDGQVIDTFQFNFYAAGHKIMGRVFSMQHFCINLLV